MQSKESRVLLSLLLVLSVVAVTVSAAHWSTDPVQIQARVRRTVERLLCILYLMAPPVVLTLIAVSVIMMILHAENPDKRGAAKKLFKNAIFGGVMVIALVQIAQTLPEPVRIVINMNYCLTVGGEGDTGPSPGPSGYLVFPPNGATLPMLVLVIPASLRRFVGCRHT